jgi:hypothetical protein
MDGSSPSNGADAGTDSGGSVQGDDSGADSGANDAAANDASDAGCTLGALSCNGAQPQICASGGTWQNVGAPCTGSTPVCLAGACVQCLPGSMECAADAGAAVDTCSAEGAWGSPVACTQPTPACAGGLCVCPNGDALSNGVCCPTAETGCSGVCVNEQNDNDHCGGCSISCTGQQNCINGHCAVPASLVVAHTAPGVPPIRLCFATGSGASPFVVGIPALPDGPAAAPPYPAGSYPGVTAGTPGIYPGTLFAVPTVAYLSSIQLTPFAILASSVANDVNFDGGAGVNAADGGLEEDCVHLIGTHGLGTGDTGAGSIPGRLTPGTDYFPLGSIPASTLLDDDAYLVTVNGCLPGGEADPPAAAAGYTCGPGYDGGVSIGVGVAQLDTTTKPDGGTIGVQFAHRSTAFENTPIVYCADPPSCSVILPVHDPATDGVWPAFFQYSSAGTPGYVPIDVAPSAGPVTYGANTVTPATTVTGGAAVLSVNLAGVDAGVAGYFPTVFGVSVQPLDGGPPNMAPWPGLPAPPNGTGPGDVYALPLSTIEAASEWTASIASTPGGASFSYGQTYTLILVGDPLAQQSVLSDGGANPAFDGRGLHFLAFPNEFTPKTLPF